LTPNPLELAKHPKLNLYKGGTEKGVRSMSKIRNEERKISRRRFLASVGMMASSVYLAGCVAPSQPGAPAAPEAPQEMPTPTPAISQVGTGDIEIDFWHGLTGADGATMSELLSVYVEQNPEIRIRQEVMAWDIFYQKLPTSVIAGTPPDVVITHEWAVAQFASRDMLRDAEDFYSDRGLEKSDFIDFAMRNITYEGNAQGVLLDNHGYGLYINTELFEEAGVDPEQPPQSGAEFIDIAQRLTRDTNGRHPNEEGFDANNVAVWGVHMNNIRWTPLSTIWQNGGDTISEDGTQSLLNEEPVRQALQFWYDAIHTYQVAPVPVGFDSGDAYSNGRLAMWMNGSWGLNFIKDRPELGPPVTKIWRTPQWGSVQPNTWMSAHVMAIPSGADEARQEAAADLILWLSNNGLMWAESGQPPARISQQSSAELQAHWHTGIFGEMFQEIGRTERQHVNIVEIQAAYQPEFSAILTNTKSLDEALDDAHERVQRILERGS
jgi:ABC-type glycerol-3-phosphate transport system substrate-binding protein